MRHLLGSPEVDEEGGGVLGGGEEAVGEVGQGGHQVCAQVARQVLQKLDGHNLNFTDCYLGPSSEVFAFGWKKDPDMVGSALG